MPDLTDDILEAWLRPAVVSLDSEEIARYRSVVAKVKSKLTSTSAFHLVEVAYGVPRLESRAWFVDRIREGYPDFVDAAQDELIARLGCCAILKGLKGGDKASLLCLLAQSASFLGSAPAAPELAALVELALHEQASGSRERPEWAPITAEIASILTDGPAPAEEGEAPESELDVQARAINEIAEAVDRLAGQVEERSTLIDEEYNALWWSYTRRSTTEQIPWPEVAPLARRAVLSAHELGRLITLVPNPPMARGLLALALEGHADERVKLSEVMTAAAESNVDVVADSGEKLLPISTAVSKIAEFGLDQSTWLDALRSGATLRLPVDIEVSALDAAAQLLREVDIGALL